MIAVYRAPMRSRDDRVDVAATHGRALAIQVVGFGAAPEDPRAARRVERFAEVPEGSFVWTRELDGPYRLGRIVGPYRRDASPDAAHVDLIHVRPCTWLPDPLPEASVPVAVLATYARGGRNLQQTHSATVGFETSAVWERFS